MKLKFEEVESKLSTPKEINFIAGFSCKLTQNDNNEHDYNLQVYYKDPQRRLILWNNYIILYFILSNNLKYFYI